MGGAHLAINEKTKVSLTIGAIFAVILFVGGGAWKASAFASGIEVELKSLRGDLTTLAGDRFTLAMASEQALRTAMANPGLRVPDPRNPGQFFFVESKR